MPAKKQETQIEVQPTAPEPRTEDVDAPPLPEIDQESMDKAADIIEQPPEDGQANVVRYLGIVSERRITQEEWEQAGVSGQEGVVWTKDSGNTLPLDNFSEAALEALRRDGEFQIVRDEE